MKPFDAQMLHQPMKVIGRGSGLGSRLSHRPAPAAAVICDDTVTRSRERRSLVFPVLAAAGIRMQENNRHATAPAVLVPEAHARKVRVCFARLGKGQSG